MKIAFDAKRYYNNATGLGFYSRTLVDGLRHFYPEHDYLLFTPYIKKNIAPNLAGARLPDQWWTRRLHPLWRSRWIVGQLKREGVQLYHGLSHELPTGLRKAGIASVVSMHDLIYLRYPDLYPAIDRFFYQQKYKSAAFQADQVVAISQQTRSDLIELLGLPPEKIRVIGQSCDSVFERLSLYQLPDPDAVPLPPELHSLPAHYLIAVGSLSERKNWHRLIEALAITRKNGFEIPLVAVGTGRSAYARSLPRLAEALGVKVFWLDRHIESPLLAALYRRALALVYPSIFEGFGIPILEALTTGIPVLTSRGGCFEEVGGAAACYADPLSSESIAEQLIRLSDIGFRQTLQAQAPAQIQRFASARICSEWMDVYRRLVSP